MLNQDKNEQTIFQAAMRLTDPAHREAYVRQTCGDDPALLARLTALLQAHNAQHGLLDALIPEHDVTACSSAISEGPGTVIGRYRLLEKIGEGGMAVVYMAEQTEPIRRKVALKIIKLGMDTRQVIARFEAERQALALMDHPSIAKVFDAGATEAGRPYFVMELVQGVSITEYCDKSNLSTKDRLALFMQVCSAVQHAHTKGIIHRDIKPSNVMVTHHDGKPVPKVIDFGIAKAIDQKLTEKTLFTRYAHIIGTPAYMSPEQAELTDSDIDTRSDIYSLGVLLYELLTGTTPVSEEELRKVGYSEMQRVIREQEPAKPSTKLSTLGDTLTDIAKRRNSTPELLRKAVRGDLDWIVMKSLEKDRMRRYGTVGELAVDIERHLNNEAVLARPPSTIYRFRKLVCRNKGVFFSAAAVASVLVLGVIVSSWQAIQATQAKRAERGLRQEAEARELYTRRLAYASDMSLAQQVLAMNDLGRARRLLEAHRPVPGAVDLRDWEWRYLWQECRSEALTEFCRCPEPVQSVAFSPDGKMLALPQAAPRFVGIWDVSSRRQIATLPLERPGRFVAFSPQGDLVATDSGNRILLWRTDTWNLVGVLDLNGRVQALKFSPYGRLLASLSFPDEVTVWAVDPLTVVHRIRGVRPLLRQMGALTFSSDGRYLAIGDADRRLQAIDVAGGNTIFDIAEAHPEPLTAVAWSPDGSILASGSGYTLGAIRLWDAVSGTLLGALEGHTHWVCELTFSADSAWLYSASADQTIRIWDVRQRQCLTILRGSRDEINGLALSPDGATLAGGCKDGTVAFWDAHPRPDQEQPGRIPMDPLARPAFAPDSQVVAVPRGGIVRLFDLTTLEQIEQLPALGDQIQQVAYSPDGTLLVGGDARGKIRIWSCIARRLLRELDAGTAGIRLLAFRTDGRHLLSVAESGQVIWWDTLTWQDMRTLAVDSKSSTVLAVAPEGRPLLAATTSPSTVQWLNAETGELLAELNPGHRLGLEDIAFSPTGAGVASVANDGTLALWDPFSFMPIAVFKGHMLAAHAVAFSPDGKRLATGGGGREAVKLWDLSTQREVMTLSGEGSYFQFVGFSPDGRWLAACGLNGQLHLWRAPSWEEIEAAENNRAEGGPGASASQQTPINPLIDSNDGKVQGKEE